MPHSAKGKNNYTLNSTFFDQNNKLVDRIPLYF